MPENTGRGMGTPNREGKEVKKQCTLEQVTIVSIWGSIHWVPLGDWVEGGSQNMVLGAATLASAADRLEMQVHRLPSDLPY